MKQFTIIVRLFTRSLLIHLNVLPVIYLHNLSLFIVHFISPNFSYYFLCKYNGRGGNSFVFNVLGSNVLCIVAGLSSLPLPSSRLSIYQQQHVVPRGSGHMSQVKSVTAHIHLTFFIRFGFCSVFFGCIF